MYKKYIVLIKELDFDDYIIGIVDKDVFDKTYDILSKNKLRYDWLHNSDEYNASIYIRKQILVLRSKT